MSWPYADDFLKMLDRLDQNFDIDDAINRELEQLQAIHLRVNQLWDACCKVRKLTKAINDYCIDTVRTGAEHLSRMDNCPGAWILLSEADEAVNIDTLFDSLDRVAESTIVRDLSYHEYYHFSMPADRMRTLVTSTFRRLKRTVRNEKPAVLTINTQELRTMDRATIKSSLEQLWNYEQPLRDLLVEAKGNLIGAQTQANEAVLVMHQHTQSENIRRMAAHNETRGTVFAQLFIKDLKARKVKADMDSDDLKLKRCKEMWDEYRAVRAYNDVQALDKHWGELAAAVQLLEKTLRV